MKTIDKKLLFHLVNVVWQDCNEDESVPATIQLMQVAITLMFFINVLNAEKALTDIIGNGNL